MTKVLWLGCLFTVGILVSVSAAQAQGTGTAHPGSAFIDTGNGKLKRPSIIPTSALCRCIDSATGEIVMEWQSNPFEPPLFNLPAFAHECCTYQADGAVCSIHFDGGGGEAMMNCLE